MAQETTPALPRELELPLLPVRSTVLFPHSMMPLTVGRPDSLMALDALGEDRLLAVVTQRDPQQDSPDLQALHDVGTVASVLRVARLQQEKSAVVAFCEGRQRIRIARAIQHRPFLKVLATVLEDIAPARPDAELAALERNVRDLFQEIVERSSDLSKDLLAVALGIEGASAITDFVAASMPALPVELRQELLETLDVRLRMRRLIEELARQREELRLRDKIRSEVSQKFTDAQREAILREQLKAIQRELGETDESTRDLADLRERLDAAGLPEEARNEAERELAHLQRIPPASAEYSVTRTYLEWLASLPWSKSSSQEVDVDHAARILDEDHHDLEKVKERFLEHLAVFQLKRDLRGPILCLVGPPGVGKTSIGRSVARALGRSFVRISLGGMHDEAEIRGHRRTYIGALPGQIIQGLRRAGTNDPVFMLDEVDKLGRDFRGDPAAALLEVLDPEQNSSFRDHYLDIPFDLSNILFITTANVLHPIPLALLDRMEIIELPGYASEDKAHIASRYLIPKQARAHGLELGVHLSFTDEGLREIIHHYTDEAGVRDLERRIAAICRKRARQVVRDGASMLAITPEVVRSMLGAPRYLLETEIEERTRTPGVAVALAWTPRGGDILFVEAALLPRDKGELTITGQVRPVMRESTRAALTWVYAHAELLGLDPADLRAHEVHVHIPAGAVPKDGPSAGLVMVAALASLFTGVALRPRVAMTGEITLSGRVLPVGGIREKVLAAKRSGIREVVLPDRNRPDVEEDIPLELRESMVFHFVHTIEEALAIAFEPGVLRSAPQERPPQPLPAPSPEPPHAPGEPL